MNKIGGSLLLLFILIGSCSAQTYRIQKAQAFLAISVPGMAMTDDKGNVINPKPILERFIYLECSYNGKPKIDSVFYSGISFTPYVANKEEISLRIGIKKSTGQPVILTPKKGDHVWKIGLQQSAGDALQPEAVKKIIIKGKLGKVSFKYILNVETELATPERY